MDCGLILSAHIFAIPGSTGYDEQTKKGKDKMNFVIWLIVGGILGWLASIVMKTNGQMGLILNVVVGIIGAFVAGVVLTPMLGIATINQNNFSLPGLLVSFVGAVILLAVVSLIRRT
jgi:uncharacterized membrane protein YeaQ/YmgE (transglycosylase-associated protein family)